MRKYNNSGGGGSLLQRNPFRHVAYVSLCPYYREIIHRYCRKDTQNSSELSVQQVSIFPESLLAGAVPPEWDSPEDELRISPLKRQPDRSIEPRH